MLRSVLAWYYLLFVLIIITFLLTADFGPLNLGLRLLLLFLIFVALLTPALFGLAAKREHRSDVSSVSILASANKDLEGSTKALEAKVRELETANERLKQTGQAKSDFVASVAHQLRTPLSAIKWTLHMMLNGELGPVTEDQKSFLKKGFDSVGRITTVVNDWLNLDYIEANHEDYKFVSINLAELIDGVGFEFGARLVEKSIKLIIHRPKSNMPEVELDPVKFSMVVENLLDNAIKYSPNGGSVEVTIIDDRVNSPTPEVEIQIKDQGIGIPEAERGKIFERFFRTSNAVKQSPQGTGLGLSIAKNIIEHHHGKIWFESQVEKGTTFFVTIPLRQNKV